MSIKLRKSFNNTLFLFNTIWNFMNLFKCHFEEILYSVSWRYIRLYKINMVCIFMFLGAKSFKICVFYTRSFNFSCQCKSSRMYHLLIIIKIWYLSICFLYSKILIFHQNDLQNNRVTEWLSHIVENILNSIIKQ